MVNKISFTLLALLLSFCLALVGCSTSGGKNAQGVENGEGIEQEQGETGQEEISIRLGHHHAVDGSVDKLANKISELAAEKSGGAMKIEVFPGGQLGQEQEAIDGINMGTLEMSIVSPGLMDQYDPIFGIETLPFIFEDWDHADSALNGEVGQVLRDRLLEESDIHIMGFMHLGFRHMITQSKPIESLEDIQGMKMRSPEAWVWVRMFELLGANPTPVTWGEAYTALQTGVVEGMESPASNILDMKFNEVTDYLILSNHMFGTITVVLNEKVYQDLTDEQQNILDEAVTEAIDDINENVARPEDKQAIETLKESGMTVIELTDVDKWRSAVEPMYEEFTEKAPGSSEVIEMIHDLK